MFISDSIRNIALVNRYEKIISDLINQGPTMNDNQVKKKLESLEGLMRIEPLNFEYTPRTNQVYLVVSDPRPEDPRKVKEKPVYIVVPSKLDLLEYKLDFLPTAVGLNNLIKRIEQAYLNVSILNHIGTVKGISADTYKTLLFESVDN